MPGSSSFSAGGDPASAKAQGFRVGIIARPVSQRRGLRPPQPARLYFGITAGNMDSMVNRYTRSAVCVRTMPTPRTPKGGKRPDRAVIVYSQRCREAFRTYRS